MVWQLRLTITIRIVQWTDDGRYGDRGRPAQAIVRTAWITRGPERVTTRHRSSEDSHVLDQTDKKLILVDTSLLRVEKINNV